MRLHGVDEAPSCWEPLNEEPLEAPLGRKGSKPKGSVPSPGMGGGGGGVGHKARAQGKPSPTPATHQDPRIQEQQGLKSG